MIEPAFRALLVACIGASPLLPAGLFAAGGAAIAMSTIAVGADEEHGVALLAETDSLQEYRFAVSLRHASSQAGTRQRHRFRGRLEPPLFGLPDEGCRTWNPAASNDRVPGGRRSRCWEVHDAITRVVPGTRLPVIPLISALRCFNVAEQRPVGHYVEAWRTAPRSRRSSAGAPPSRWDSRARNASSQENKVPDGHRVEPCRVQGP